MLEYVYTQQPCHVAEVKGRNGKRLCHGGKPGTGT